MGRRRRFSQETSPLPYKVPISRFRELTRQEREELEGIIRDLKKRPLTLDHVYRWRMFRKTSLRMTQIELGGLLGYCNAVIHRIETAKNPPNKRFLFRLEKVFLGRHQGWVETYDARYIKKKEKQLRKGVYANASGH